MSRMIKCDSCGKVMYEDSRTEKSGYHCLIVDNEDFYHLCRDCYQFLLMGSIFHKVWSIKDMCYVDKQPGD